MPPLAWPVKSLDADLLRAADAVLKEGESLAAFMGILKQAFRGKVSR